MEKDQPGSNSNIKNKERNKMANKIKNKSKNQKPKITKDAFHFHEIVDRCDIICSMIDDFILEHPACNLQMKCWAEDAQRQLCNISSIALAEGEKFKA